MIMIEKIKEAMAALSPIKLEATDYAARGFHLDIQVAPEQVVAAAEILDREGFSIEAVTGVDWLGEQAEAEKKPAAKVEAAGESPLPEAEVAAPVLEQMEVVTDYFNHAPVLCRVVVRARVPRANPEIPSISGVFAGADWHERETHDFFGIKFLGHPNLAPLLLPEDADFHPLLKDFKS